MPDGATAHPGERPLAGDLVGGPVAGVPPARPAPTTGDLFDAMIGYSSELFKGDFEILRESYVPARLPHREHQLRQVAEVLAPALKGSVPSNLLIYGKIGSGKTAVVAQVRADMQRRSEAKGRVTFISVNCASQDGSYSLLQSIGNTFAQRESERIPTGWSLDRVQAVMRELLDRNGGTLVLILDEIDRLVKKNGDGVLYTLSELNNQLSRGRVAILGISNDLTFTSGLDARVRSRLHEEKILFPPYDAPQLQDILRDRALEVFREGVLDAGVIERCAAYAALEHGDARRALSLLRTAAQIAERERAKRVTSDHVVKAKSRLERDIILDCVRTLPQHCKVLLYAILQIYERRRTGVLTGEVYESYAHLSQRLGLPPLHSRSISNYLTELESLGLIGAKIVSKGRGGRTREIVVEVPTAETIPALEEDELLAPLARTRNLSQTILSNFDNPNRSGSF